MKRIFYILTLLVVTVGAGLLVYENAEDVDRLRGFEYVNPFPAQDFTLVHASGEAVSLSDFEDEIVMLYFGYTFCPDICPQTLLDLKLALEGLGDVADDVQVIMVTVDPARDTPELVAEYAAAFSPDFIGLSGTAAEIADVAEKYGIIYEAHEGTAATGYLVDHTTSVIMIDQAGNVRATYPFGITRDDFAHDLTVIAAES